MKQVFTSSNWMKIRTDRLNPVLTGSNQTRLAQTCFDQLKPGQRGSNRVKLDQTGTNRTQTGLKPDQTGSNRF